MHKLYYAVRLFFYGLEKNFKIIRFGDVPVYHVRIEAEEKYKRLNSSRLPRLVAAGYLFREFFLSRHKRYVGPVPEALYCGSTRNNEREFLFLQKLMAGTEAADLLTYAKEKNVSFYPAKKGKNDLYHIFVRFVLLCCCLVYLWRIKVNPTSLRFLIRFASAYYRLLVYFSRANEKPKVSIFANDHTDISVALSMVMKLQGVPRIYVQHAEVTKDFPALDFEISILRNKKSLDTYAEIGKIEGATYIIPREEGSASFKEITDASPDKVRVVIYLSSTFLKEKVEEVVNLCQYNADVESVAIKKHPRSQENDFSFLNGRVHVHDVVPEYDHIALVPNSSVVIDLLHDGVKVYQLFELDNIREDYYGFVKNSVTLRVAISELKDGFWKNNFYNEDWLERFETYDPSISDHWTEDLGRLRSEVSMMLMES
ncbi:hypothetical protein HOP62_02645 [Halomonas sp. MCCC 1A17488]|uniref:hypothetical protein n=1 Tax=unclassified Halomonas TaxID=2609666 RepID=UPI0018D23C81|nr:MULTISPECIES: hypothetical protein [unclassified Halomonas]MCE8014972.1 hypothetical protein [Halomonas sp. MCCC 1A17488]MCG3238305.1 hypothetical protein [Halomonas sp. MCCC 1A17488]QPP47942.1 hypothetical protein I4484_11755 [Halomonas sp. SS10-MC5]